MLSLIFAIGRDVVRGGWGIGLGDPVVAPRRVIALPTDAEQRQRLPEISRSGTEPTSRVERARIVLAYLQDPSTYAVARAIGVTQQAVTRCLERAAELGVIEALDDRPRAGRDPVITACGENLAGGIGVPQGQGFGLSPRAVDHPVACRACPAPWTRCRASEPGQAGPRDGVQDLGRARSQAAQEPALAKAGCATTWSSAIPSSSPRWPKSSVSTGKWRCCVAKR